MPRHRRYGGYSKTQYYRIKRRARIELNSFDQQSDKGENIALESEVLEEVDSEYRGGEVSQNVDCNEEVDTLLIHSNNVVEDDHNSQERPLIQEKNQYLDELRRIVFEGKITVKATNSLLSFINKHTNISVPCTYSSLFKSNSSNPINLIPVGEGEYVQFGIQRLFLNNYFKCIDQLNFIQIDVGIDGMQFHKSAKLCGWPIVGKIVDCKEMSPFFIWNLCRKRPAFLI